MAATESTHTLPDGREVRASFEPVTDEWTVALVGVEGAAASSRVISDALEELLDPDWNAVYRGGTWFWQAADALACRDTPLGRRCACPCCGYLTLLRAPHGTYELCEVCFWEEDGIQLRDPDDAGSANHVSLNQARENFRRYGACERDCRHKVRPPEPAEIP